MKITQFVGTRPELIKLAPLVWAADEDPRVHIKTVFTGQHFELVDKLAGLLDIPFDAPSVVKLEESTVPKKLASLINFCSDNLCAHRPDFVIVQGDTLSAAAASLAASFLRIPVAHIEAGLRSYDINNPWPEEQLRKVISHIATVHFAPTANAVQNLLREGINKESIYLVGNTIIDSVVRILGDSRRQPSHNHKYGVLTMHRREMLLNNSVSDIIRAVEEVAIRFGLRFYFPVHPTPELRRQLDMIPHKNFIDILNPIDYPEFISMLAGSELVITDSGGIQEEVTYLKKPTICLRDTTERPEAVAAGSVVLCGSRPSSIVSIAEKLLSKDNNNIDKFAFGSGRASFEILDVMRSLQQSTPGSSGFA